MTPYLPSYAGVQRPIAAASLGQVYKAVLKESGEAVAVKVQRPNVAPTIMRDLLIFRSLAWLVTPLSKARLGCNAELIVDEFGQVRPRRPRPTLLF